MRTDPIVEPGDMDRSPFSNSSMGEIWLASVCGAGEGCVHDSVYGQSDEELGAEVQCPLITLSLMQVWPHEWQQTDHGPGACSEYTTDLPEAREPGVVSVDLFGVYNEEPV